MLSDLVRNGAGGSLDCGEPAVDGWGCVQRHGQDRGGDDLDGPVRTSGSAWFSASRSSFQAVTARCQAPSADRNAMRNRRSTHERIGSRDDEL